MSHSCGGPQATSEEDAKGNYRKPDCYQLIVQVKVYLQRHGEIKGNAWKAEYKSFQLIFTLKSNVFKPS